MAVVRFFNTIFTPSFLVFVSGLADPLNREQGLATLKQVIDQALFRVFPSRTALSFGRLLECHIMVYQTLRKRFPVSGAAWAMAGRGPARSDADSDQPANGTLSTTSRS
jgi:hypothetical protein